MRRWLSRLWDALTRPPAIRPMTDEELHEAMVRPSMPLDPFASLTDAVIFREDEMRAGLRAVESLVRSRCAAEIDVLRAEVVELRDQHISGCMHHRCPSHRDVPQFNTTASGAECGACVRDQREAAAASLRRM